MKIYAATAGISYENSWNISVSTDLEEALQAIKNSNGRDEYTDDEYYNIETWENGEMIRDESINVEEIGEGQYELL